MPSQGSSRLLRVMNRQFCLESHMRNIVSQYSVSISIEFNFIFITDLRESPMILTSKCQGSHKNMTAQDIVLNHRMTSHILVITYRIAVPLKAPLNGRNTISNHISLVYFIHALFHWLTHNPKLYFIGLFKKYTPHCTGRHKMSSLISLVHFLHASCHWSTQ